MAEEQGGEKPLSKLTIRLVGFQPGASQDELAAALGRLYKGRSQEEIRKALAKVPFTLTRSATEEQARKIRSFLESKGAVLEITYQAVLKAPPSSVEAQGELPEPSTTGALASISRPLTWAKDRRSRPRVHPGLPLEPMGLKEILSRGLVLLRENLVLFFLLMLLPNLVSFLLARLVGGVEDMGFSPASLGSLQIVVWRQVFLSLLCFLYGLKVPSFTQSLRSTWGTRLASQVLWGRFGPNWVPCFPPCSWFGF